MMNTRFIVSFFVAILCAFPASARADALDVDIIPDFSTVGYCHSDSPYPDYPVVEIVSEKTVSDMLKNKTYPDTTSIIQAAIDRAASAPGGGTVLLLNGVYNVGGVIFLDGGKAVLRGESREGTVIRCTGLKERPGIVVGRCHKYNADDDPSKYGDFSGRKFVLRKMAVAGAEGRSSFGKHFLCRWLPYASSPTVKEKIRVTEKYCPVGRFSVEVEDASVFSVGEDVLVERPHNDAWISDIGMDKIASNGREKGKVKQWNERNMKMTWSRKITRIDGRRIYFDAPLVQSLDKHYGGGFVCKYRLKRVKGCGIENLTLDSWYDAAVVNDKGEAIDENHAWWGMYFIACEDCFARAVTVTHFGFAAVELSSGARCVTVDDCSFINPVSVPTMARRYGFCISGADMCLFKNCVCEKSAIGFASNAKGGGPNVFHNCRGLNMRTGAGPHQCWSTGSLYDCCYNSAGFRVTDHGNAGTGHGWIGANTIFWNVETEGNVECESPWAAENTPGLKFSSPKPSARNYSIGMICGKRVQKNVSKDYYGHPVEDYYIGHGYDRRPDAKWYPYVDYGQSGTSHIALPCDEARARFDWWPRFSISSFTNPLSLYECQLEDRQARKKSQISKK